MDVDLCQAVRFLELAFAPDDWVALLVKAHDGDATVRQRIVPVSVARSTSVLAWLTRDNQAGRSVYVSVNACASRQTSRRRAAIACLRHVFLDVDRDGAEVMRRLAQRSDLPPVSYTIASSPERIHILWRVDGFERTQVEALQVRLARQIRADPAATSCAQLTRLAGFRNRKYPDAPLVTVEYRDPHRVYTPADFPRCQLVQVATPTAPADAVRRVRLRSDDIVDAVERARRYAAAVPPAVAGQHGDVRTFQLCCRLVRGFDLSDAEALLALSEWNARCQPPWSLRELAEKVRRARRYGREPIGGLLAMNAGSP